MISKKYHQYMENQIKMIRVGSLMINHANKSWRIITEIVDEGNETRIVAYVFDFNEYVSWPESYYHEQIKFQKYEFCA